MDLRAGELKSEESRPRARVKGRSEAEGVAGTRSMSRGEGNMAAVARREEPAMLAMHQAHRTRASIGMESVERRLSVSTNVLIAIA